LVLVGPVWLDLVLTDQIAFSHRSRQLAVVMVVATAPAALFPLHKEIQADLAEVRHIPAQSLQELLVKATAEVQIHYLLRQAVAAAVLDLLDLIPRMQIRSLAETAGMVAPVFVQQLLDNLFFMLAVAVVVVFSP
jgi:hypothetical protein